MKKVSSLFLGATLLSLSLLVPANLSLAQQAGQREDSVSQPRRPGFFHILGSIVFTTLHVPMKIGNVRWHTSHRRGCLHDYVRCGRSL